MFDYLGERNRTRKSYVALLIILCYYAIMLFQRKALEKYKVVKEQLLRYAKEGIVNT